MSAITRGIQPTIRASRRTFGVELAWIGLVAVGALLIVLRRPEAFLAAEFTWEEGNAFYAPLFFHPPGALLLEPWGGYLQVVQRLGYELLRAVPVPWVPLAENVIAAVGLLAVAAYLASSRMASLIPSERLRLALGGILLLLPAQGDILGSWVNVQWYGALWLALLALTKPSSSAMVRWAERVTAALVSFSGPFSTLFAPLFWWRAATRRTQADLVLAAIVTVGGVVQLGFALASGRGDVVDPRPLGMSVATFAIHAAIVAVIGERLSNAVGDAGLPAVVVFLAGLTLIGLLAVAALQSLPARVLPFAYAAAVVAVSGIVVHGGANVWPPGENERYFLLCACLVAGTVAVAASARRLVAVPLVVLLAAGIVLDFRLEPAPPQGWAQTSECIGSHDPCVVPVWPREYDIRWPGMAGTYEMPEHVDP